MVKVKLNEKYGNEFLTTQMGEIFYNKNNKLNKEYNVVDVDLENIEIRSLLKQGILVVDKEKEKVKVDKILKDDIKKDIIIKEIKTQSNDEKLEK